MHYLLNLYAVILPLCLFIYWGIIGYATLSLLNKKNDLLKNLLLAPITGVCITLLSVFTLNRLGMPVKSFAKELCLLLLFFSCYIILYKFKSVIVHVRYYLNFILILLVSFCIVAYPLMLYGFDWISFSNDDMTNYCLGALRFLNHGYFDLPNVQNIITGADYSLYYWFIHVPGMARPGSELILAWLSGVTNISCLQIFMVLIVTAHMILVSTTGSLVCNHKNKQSLALITCTLFSFSALSIFGLLYQLIAQIFGLSLFIAVLTLLLKQFKPHDSYNILTYGCLIAIIFSTFLIIYPEMLPFLFFTFSFYYLILLIKGWKPNKSFFKVLFVVMCFTIFFINTHIFPILEYINIQITKGTSESVTSIFPYYFLPTGIANLWGLIPITISFSEPLNTIAIIFSIILSIVVLITSLKLALKSSIAAIVTLVMTLFALILFMKHYGFGLFKLAMYSQPFIIAIITYSLFSIIKNKRIRNYVVLSLITFSFFSIHYYLIRSKALTPGPFTEVAYGSNTRLNHELKTTLSELPASAVLFADDFNVSVIKLQAFMSYPRRIIFLSAPPIFMLRELKGYEDYQKLFPDVIYQKIYRITESLALKKIINSTPQKIDFKLFDSQLKSINFFKVSACENDISCFDHAYLLSDTSLRSILNKRYSFANVKKNFNLQPLKSVKNHLIFTDSSLGKIYYSPYAAYHNLDVTSFFNIEPDYMYPNNNMQGLGRFLTFRIINPSNQFRLELAITNTFDGDRNNKVVPIEVVGDKRVKLSPMGRGSARLISSPFSSQIVNGLSYIVLDLSNRIFYNQNIQNSVLDNRHIITYGRDISLISESDYQKLQPPSGLNKFPDDLANNNLEYSGIYEDGWISENSFFQLMQSKNHSNIIIKGLIPKIEDNFTPTIIVLLNGKMIYKKLLQMGNFDLKIPIFGQSTGRKKLEIHFDKFQYLPNGDGRPVVALMKKIEFV